MTFRVDVVSRITQSQRLNKRSLIVALIQVARRPCGGLNYFFGANFGSRCLGQASKKGSSGLDLLLLRRCARSTRNIWLACVQRLRRFLRTARCAGPPKRSGQRGYLPQSEIRSKISWRDFKFRVAVMTILRTA